MSMGYLSYVKLGNYTFEIKEFNMKTEKRELKVGDKVKVRDFSWCVCIKNGKAVFRGNEGLNEIWTVEDYDIYNTYPTKIRTMPVLGFEPNNIGLVNDSGDRLYTQARFCVYYEEPIYVGLDKVTIKDDGSVWIGNREIPTNIMDKIIDKRKQVWDDIPF